MTETRVIIEIKQASCRLGLHEELASLGITLLMMKMHAYESLNINLDGISLLYIIEARRDIL